MKDFSERAPQSRRAIVTCLRKMICDFVSVISSWKIGRYLLKRAPKASLAKEFVKRIILNDIE